MNLIVTGLVLSLLATAGVLPALAGSLTDKVKVETLSVGLHPGMDPGMYVCAGGHLHIKATVQNLGRVALGPVKVQGKAFGPSDNLLGTATASTRVPVLGPGQKAEVDLEFLTVGGPLIRGIKRHEITVVEAPAAR
jgi:hypothetical protein